MSNWYYLIRVCGISEKQIAGCVSKHTCQETGGAV